MCMVLLSVIGKAVDSLEKMAVPNDTVMDEIKKINVENWVKDDDIVIAISLYMFRFGELRG